MPIGNTALSSYRVISVQSPVEGNPPSLSSTYQIAYKRFTRSIETSAQGKTLIQGWPLNKYIDVKPYTYITEIEVPILFDEDGLRNYQKEFGFFTDWMWYLLSSYDQVSQTSPKSLIVEKMSIQISEKEISLSMTLKSNFYLPWVPNAHGVYSTIHARQASYYDTFIQMRDHPNTSGGSYSTISNATGWNNKYGISSFNINFSAETEEISLSKTGIINNYTAKKNYVDMINLKNVTFNGDIEVFGTSHTPYPISIQYENGLSLNTVDDTIFDMALNKGGIQIYIGESDGTTYTSVVPILLLPTGTIINSASSTLSGNQIYKHKRAFTGFLTDTPKNSLRTSALI